MEREYRVVDDRGALWWRGVAPTAADALASALAHLRKFGKRGLALHVLIPGQRFDPKTTKRRHV